MTELVQEARSLWSAGGWAMYPLAANALVLYGVAFSVFLTLRSLGYGSIGEDTWRRWIERPAEREGRIGEILDFVLDAPDSREMAVRFGELHSTEIRPIGRELRFLKRAVSTAPLLGLLGTVTGMLTTFSALATGSGGQKTMDLVAGGISEALITTETGLVIALPGVFMQYFLKRERDRYEAFLARLETACSQHLYWSSRRTAA